MKATVDMTTKSTKDVLEDGGAAGLKDAIETGSKDTVESLSQDIAEQVADQIGGVGNKLIRSLRKKLFSPERIEERIQKIVQEYGEIEIGFMRAAGDAGISEEKITADLTKLVKQKEGRLLNTAFRTRKYLQILKNFLQQVPAALAKIEDGELKIMMAKEKEAQDEYKARERFTEQDLSRVQREFQDDMSDTQDLVKMQGQMQKNLAEDLAKYGQLTRMIMVNSTL
jgi:hypothetical protein